jgi:HAMP domain-containing protein
MKLGAKLITGFLVVALILVAVAGVSTVLGQQAEQAQKEADDEMEELQSINGLQNALYEAHMLMTDYVSNEDPTEAAAIVADLFVLQSYIIAANENLTEEFAEESEFSDSWAKIGELMSEIGQTFSEVYGLKEAGQLGVVGPISKLNKKVEEILTGTGPEDQAGLDYVLESLSVEMSMDADHKNLISQELKVVKELSIGLYREFLLGMSVITTENLTVANATLDHKEMVSQANDAFYTTLKGMVQGLSGECEVHAETEVVLASIGETLEKMDEIFEENLSLKMKGQLDNDTIEVVVGTLATMVEETMMGTGPFDQEGFDYITDMLNEEESEVWAKLYVLNGEQTQLNTLINSVHEDFMDITTILTTHDLEEADALHEEFEAKEHAHESTHVALMASFEALSAGCEVHAELTVIMENLEADFEEMDDIGHENISRKLSGKLDQIHWISSLEAVVEECMIGEGPDDEEGLDFVAASIKAKSEESRADAEDARATATIITLAGVILALVIAVMLGIVISRAIRKPVVGMTEAAKKVREGDLDVSVDEKGSDEIAELGKAFNQMILSVRLVAGEMGMDSSSGDQDDDAEPATGEPNTSKDN